MKSLIDFVKLRRVSLNLTGAIFVGEVRAGTAAGCASATVPASSINIRQLQGNFIKTS
jgi:hypothetical protein